MALPQRDGPRVAPGVDVVSKAETVRVDDRLLDKIKQAVDAALSYWPAPKAPGQIRKCLILKDLRRRKILLVARLVGAVAKRRPFRTTPDTIAP